MEPQNRNGTKEVEIRKLEMSLHLSGHMEIYLNTIQV